MAVVASLNHSRSPINTLRRCRPLLYTVVSSRVGSIVLPSVTLLRYDPDRPHYLGYVFVASPHLEGVIEGERQPLFANGVRGIELGGCF